MAQDPPPHHPHQQHSSAPALSATRRHRVPARHPLAALTDGPAGTIAASTSAHDPELADEPPAPTAALFPDLPTGLNQLLFTAEQAGVLLTIRPSWLRRAAAEGTIASTYLGKHLRFSLGDLSAIITAGARGHRPEPARTPPTPAASQPATLTRT